MYVSDRIEEQQDRMKMDSSVPTLGVALASLYPWQSRTEIYPGDVCVAARGSQISVFRVCDLVSR